MSVDNHFVTKMLYFKELKRVARERNSLIDPVCSEEVIRRGL